MNRKLFRRLVLGALLLAVAIPALVIFVRYRRDLSLAYQCVDSGGTLIQTACGPIQYTEFGEGPPMLIVHGAGGGYDQGEYLAHAIGGDYRWIAPSRFGFLGTPAPQEADSARQAAAYACLLDALGIERAGVVGVSMGGPSSLLFAAHYPQRTNSLALVSAASHANPPRPALLAGIFNLFLNDFVFWSLVNATPQGLLVALGVPAEVQEQLSPAEMAQLEAFLTLIIPMGARKQGQLLEQHMSEFDTEPLHTIRAPTLVLHAPDDTLIDIEQAEFAARRIPGAQLVPMKQGGHLALMLDANAGVREHLRDFLMRYNPR